MNHRLGRFRRKSRQDLLGVGTNEGTSVLSAVREMFWPFTLGRCMGEGSETACILPGAEQRVIRDGRDG